MSKSQLPWMKWWKADWKGDPNLSDCCPATRGIWADLCCTMDDRRTGELTGTAAQLARSARCTPEELLLAVAELLEHGAAEGKIRDGIVCVASRRMVRTYGRLNKAKIRSKEWREAQRDEEGTPDERKTNELGDGTEERGGEDERKEIKKKIASADAPPLPFKVDEAVEALSTASCGRFTASKLSKGQSINVVRLIKEAPALSTWTLVGEWLAAGGDGWKGTLDVRNLRDFSTWLAHAQAWTKNGRGPVGAGSAQSSHAKKPFTGPRAPVGAIPESEGGRLKL